MNRLNLIALALFLRAVCICACIAGVVILSEADKSSWGWLIFLAICVSEVSFKYEE